MKNESKIELVKSTLASADILVKWSFILNGMFSLGLLSFVGNSIDKQEKYSNWNLFGTALMVLGAGLLFAVFCNFLKMLALNFMYQLSDLNENSKDCDPKIYILTYDRTLLYSFLSAILFIFSLVCFISALFITKYAIFN